MKLLRMFSFATLMVALLLSATGGTYMDEKSIYRRPLFPGPPMMTRNDFIHPVPHIPREQLQPDNVAGYRDFPVVNDKNDISDKNDVDDPDRKLIRVPRKSLLMYALMNGKQKPGNMDGYADTPVIPEFYDQWEQKQQEYRRRPEIFDQTWNDTAADEADSQEPNWPKNPGKLISEIPDDASSTYAHIEQNLWLTRNKPGLPVNQENE